MLKFPHPFRHSDPNNFVAMLHLFSKRTIAIISTSKRTICTKINTYATVLPSASLSSRLLVQRPRVYPQFFQPSAFRHYATKSRKHAKPVPKSANSGKSNLVVQNIKENLPGVDNQPRLLDRLRAAGAVSDLQAPPSLSHVPTQDTFVSPAECQADRRYRIVSTPFRSLYFHISHLWWFLLLCPKLGTSTGGIPSFPDTPAVVYNCCSDYCSQLRDIPGMEGSSPSLMATTQQIFYLCSGIAV